MQENNNFRAKGSFIVFGVWAPEVKSTFVKRGVRSRTRCMNYEHILYVVGKKMVGSLKCPFKNTLESTCIFYVFLPFFK